MTISNKISDILFYALLTLLVGVLIFVANSLSISYKEALNVFDNISLLRVITYIPIKLFGYNDIALRLPFIIFYALSACLMYYITADYFKYSSDRLLNIAIFMVLPGLLSASLLVNTAIIVTFCTLLYLYYYKTYEKHNYYLLFLFLFIDNSFAIFYLALFFYSLNKKENRLLIISLILFGLSMYIYGFSTGGKPKSYFLHTFGIYASIFSPLLFLYFFYAMYRVGIKGTKTLYWYISVTALIFSIIFSIRQKVYIEDFAPYVIITLPIMLKLFLHTLRVRLPQFRGIHMKLALATLLILALNVILTLFNKPIYKVLENPKKHFAYKYHFAKEIATILKEHNINHIYSDNIELVKRLKFYGITHGDQYFISLNDYYIDSTEFAIRYYGKDVLKVHVVKMYE